MENVDAWILSNVFSDAEFIPSHYLKPLVHTFLLAFIINCPSNVMPSILPPVILPCLAYFTHRFELLKAKLPSSDGTKRYTCCNLVLIKLTRKM